jgi:hypothetical protein
MGPLPATWRLVIQSTYYQQLVTLGMDRITSKVTPSPERTPLCQIRKRNFPMQRIGLVKE